MSDAFWTAILEQLALHEGTELKPYPDTKGKLTIGIGRNLDDVGISEEEARIMLKNDVINALNSLLQIFGCEWLQFSKNRRVALTDMMFNMGQPRFKGFRKMIAAIKADNWRLAAVEALDSKWAREDVQESRSKRIAEQIREG